MSELEPTITELEPTITELEPTATERLRALLDERGVEWRRTPHYSSESIDNETVFRGEGIEWLASDHLNGRLGLRALKYEVTPAQAVEATLGSREQPPYDELIESLRRDWDIDARNVIEMIALIESD